jgi:hypothetical protein
LYMYNKWDVLETDWTSISQLHFQHMYKRQRLGILCSQLM